MITWATPQARMNTEVIVSSSKGSHDLGQVNLNRLPLNQVIGQDEAQMITLPHNFAGNVLAQWESTFDSYGLKVSTGPVVPFRATKYTRERATSISVPLLWMQHIDHMSICWPIKRAKREHIVASAENAWMLVPNTNFVVMRRFSSKENKRRVIAAPYLANSLPGAVLGLENHTNYIYRPGGELTADETRGIAAYLNSSVVDQYFRSIAGNTQVNATDLRKLPLPPLNSLIAVGQAVAVGSSLATMDAAVETILGIQLAEIKAA